MLERLRQYVHPPWRFSPLPFLGLALLLLAGTWGRSNTPAIQAPPPPPSGAALHLHFDTMLKRDADLLAGLAAERLDNTLNPLFSDYHQRLTEFTDWAFQWRTSYALLRRGAVTALTLPFSESPRLQQFGASWDDLIAARFDELVLRPSGGLAALHSAQDRWSTDIGSALEVLAQDSLRTIALLQGQEPPTLAEAVPPLGNTAETDAALQRVFDNATSPIKTRMVRPLVTRLTIRPPVAAAVTAAGESLAGAGEMALLGSFTSLAVTIAGFLSIDYLLSWADAALSRQEFEAEMHHLLDIERENLRQAWLASMQQEIDGRLSQIRALIGTNQP